MTRPSGPLRVAFVGGGAMARAHLRVLRRLDQHARVFGVYDADPATAQEFAAASVSRAFHSLDAMLATVRPEVVHVCTTAGTHFEPARTALLAGAHVYVEKPFVETSTEAAELIELAAPRRRLICCGHQILFDPAFERLFELGHTVQPFTHAESTFWFRSPTLRPDSPPVAQAAQLIDILPHPLYSLIAVMEAMAPDNPIEVVASDVSPTSIDSVLRAGPVSGRLNVSLRARPVASTLTITGENGTVGADFIRGFVAGTPNPGTTPVEKILNPVVAGLQLAGRSAIGIVKRITGHGEYPGLLPLMTRFYEAARAGKSSPVSPRHLVSVARVQEELAINVREAARRETPDLPAPADVIGLPTVAVTGAAGFFGRAIAAELAARGYRVRGVGRGANPQDPNIAEWVRADLSRPLPEDAFAGAEAVVNVAAATSGGFAAHQRNSVDVAYHVVEAAARAGIKRLVHVSSLSVLRPPLSGHEVQDERTPTAAEPRALGPYTWGKCVSEAIVLQRAAMSGVRVRVIRPAALMDWAAPEIPGLVGKRLFGAWHLGLGRPSLPFAVCGVDLAAKGVAWSISHFEQAPAVVNLIDPEIATRGELLYRMRKQGWRGRVVWVPISLLSLAVVAARCAIAYVTRRKAEALAVWQVLRPRRYRIGVSTRLLADAREEFVERTVGSSAAA